jgi:DNA-binding MarR family transcriptional regulator
MAHPGTKKTRGEVLSKTGRAAAEGKAEEQSGCVDLGPLADWVGFYLRMAQIASFQAFARRTRQHDLNPGGFVALMVIGRNPGISQTQLSRAIGVDKSSLTPALNGLARRGLVSRVRPPTDKRAYRLTLTAQGRAMLGELTACAVAHDRDLDSIVGVRDRARFLRGLRRIVETLD